jgi:hypothetical protein
MALATHWPMNFQQQPFEAILSILVLLTSESLLDVPFQYLPALTQVAPHHPQLADLQCLLLMAPIQAQTHR